MFDLGEQFGQGGFEGGRQLLDDEDGGHALAAFQQSDVVAVQVGLSGEGFLRQASDFASAAKDGSELSLQRMHGTPTRGKVPVQSNARFSSTHNCVENGCVRDIFQLR